MNARNRLALTFTAAALALCCTGTVAGVGVAVGYLCAWVQDTRTW